MSLNKILKKYVGVELFEEGRREFKEEFFNELFDPYAPVDYTQRTTLLINAILEEENLPYIFTIRYDENENKYWLLRKL